jgi:hypothetical protein
VYRQVIGGLVPDRPFLQRMERLEVSADEARSLYVAQRDEPWAIRFSPSSVRAGAEVDLREDAIEKNTKSIKFKEDQIDYLQNRVNEINGDLILKQEVKRAAKRETREWTFTRYYRYMPSDPRKSRNRREFEITVPLVFLAGWTETEIARVERTIIEFCDEIMYEDIWTGSGYEETTGTEIYESLSDSGILESDWARGWEAATDTVRRDTRKPVRVQWIWIDKTGHYKIGRRIDGGRIKTGWKYWDIPT